MGAIDTDSRSTRGPRREMHLNLVPYVDILMTIMAFLVMTAAWTRMAALETQSSTGTEEKTDPAPPPPPPLALVLRSDGVDVGGAFVAGRDWRAVGLALAAQKRESAELRVDDGVSYDDVVRLLDAGSAARIGPVRVLTSGS